MISLAKAATWFVFVALLEGCVAPSYYSVYVPSGAGELSDSYIVGIKDALTVKVGEARIVSFAILSSQNTVEVHVVLNLPAGVTARLLSRNLIIESNELEKPIILTCSRLSTTGPKYLSPLSELHGKTYNPDSVFVKPSYELYSLEFATREHFRKLDSFSLQLPEVLINGMTYKVEPINFKYRSGWGMYVGPPGP